MNSKQITALLGIVVMISIFIFAAKAVIVGGDVVSSYDNQVNNQAATQNIQPDNAAAVVSGNQTVNLSFKNGNYYPNTITLTKGIPVVLNVDLNTVKGCYRGIKIPAFGVQQTVTTTNNKIEFTPDKAGTFGFSCYMGMGTGKIVVVDETGKVPANVNTVAQDIPKGGSCGSSGGGCGCGGG